MQLKITIWDALITALRSWNEMDGTLYEHLNMAFRMRKAMNECLDNHVSMDEIEKKVMEKL